VTNLSRCEVPFESVNGWEVEIRPMVLCGWNRIDPSGFFAIVAAVLVTVAVVVGGADCELLVVEDSSDSDILSNGLVAYQ